MIVTIITLLIYLCILALVIYLVLWVMEQIGLALPPQMVRIIWVIALLVAILFILQALPGLGVRVPSLTK